MSAVTVTWSRRQPHRRLFWRVVRPLFALAVAAVVLDDAATAKAGHAGDRHVGGAGESDAVAQAGHTHQEARRGADDRKHDRARAGLVGADYDPRPDEGWDRIEPAAKDHRDLAHEDVAQHA